MHDRKLPGVYLIGDRSSLAADPDPPPPITASGSRRIVVYQRMDGDDRLADGSLERPFRTLAAALATWPKDARGNRYIIDRTGCTDELPPAFTLSGYRDSSGARFVLPEDPFYPYIWTESPFNIYARNRTLATIPAVDEWVTRPRSQLVDARVAGAGWEPDQWKGKQLLSADQYLQTIHGNTADTLFLCNNFPLQGPFEITEPTAMLVGGSDQFGGYGAVNVDNTGAAIAFVGQIFQAVTGTWTKVSFAATRAGPLSFAACEFRGNLMLNGVDDIGMGSCRLQRLEETPGQGTLDCEHLELNIGNSLIEGFRVRAMRGGVGALEMYQSVWSGADAPLGTELQSLTLYQVEVRGATGRIAPGGVATGASDKNAIGVATRSRDVSLHHVVVSDCQGDAISIGFRSGATFREVGGTGNTGVGLRVRDGAQVLVDSVSDLTGAGGDLQVGSKPPRAWTHFRETAPIGNEADFFDPARSDGSRLSLG